MERIALYGHDEVSVFGIASILDTEKIPYRRIDRLQKLDSRELLLVAGGDLTRSEVARILFRPALVLHGGSTFASVAFGAAAAEVREGPVMLPLEPGLWPRAISRRLSRLNQSMMAVPRAPVCSCRDVHGHPHGILLTPESGQYAVYRSGGCVWSTLDVGASFTHLIAESYAPEEQGGLLELLRSTSLQRAIESLYYAAPNWVRSQMQSMCYARARQRLNAATWGPSEYPADATGAALIELLKGLIVFAGGSLVRLARWPAPYRCAALMTHDVEPSRYAYTAGLASLIENQRTEDHPVLGLVSDCARRHLDGRLLTRLNGFDILCHGLTHRADDVRGVTSIARQLDEAKRRLEAQLGHRVDGYRSPRLDRSRDLVRALDVSGFEYDSSFPDCDRENLGHYGAGVRLNLPYRPPIETAAGTLRRSRCLELPLAAPDCIQPLFMGDTEDGLRRTVTAKAQFVRATGGLQVALVHAGVFGDDDAALRERHRRFVAGELQAPEAWLPHISELLDWWRSREGVQMLSHRGSLYVTNTGRQPIRGLRAIIEDETGERDVPLCGIDPGATVSASLDGRPILNPTTNSILQ